MSQWKPKQRTTGTMHKNQVACRRPPIEVVELEEGFRVDLPGGPQGWMPLTTYEKHHRPGLQVQMSNCGISGETWVKRLVGRYREKDEASLRQRLRVLEQVADHAVGRLGFRDGPLWLQVEFLENVIEFHLRPPCGCPPAVGSVAA